jgi:ATP-binding cassette subfamily G (WHITE) protein 2 (SNQ2)
MELSDRMFNYLSSRYWTNYMNPSTYWTGGVLSARSLILGPLHSARSSLLRLAFSSNCSSHTQDFVDRVSGILTNPSATTECGYYQYSSGVEDEYA